MLKILLNTVGLLLAFFTVHYLKRGILTPSESDLLILIAVLLINFFSSLITQKLKSNGEKNFYAVSKPYFKSFILTLGLATFFSNISAEFNPSRILILGTLVLHFLLEYFYLLISQGVRPKKELKIKLKISPITLILELALIIWILLYFYFYKYISLYPPIYEILFIISVIIIWIISGVFTHQFETIFGKNNYWQTLWQHLKSYIVFGSLVSFIVYLLFLPEVIIKLVFFAMLLYSFWAFLITSLVFFYQRPPLIDNVKRKFFRANELADMDFSEPAGQIENGDPHASPNINKASTNLRDQLQSVYLKKFPDVFNFVQESIKLDSFDSLKCVMLRSADTYNVEVLPEDYLELYMNLHELNDMRRLNQYLILINQRLLRGGFFVGKIESIKLRYKRFHTKYPFYIAKFFYFFDFIWRRIFPKIPILQQYYFMMTKGKDRAISMAEGLGRLYYCGFEIIASKEIENFLYFVARKVKEPSTDANPSFGPLFKMKRMGKNGKTIYVYKMRTMHPYSEYLQKLVYERYDLKEGGKFENDFRITYWGRIFRKLWLDEFPMFINYFKREMKLVGVRPLSSHYLSLYDKDLIELRQKYKPGLVPPYYADLPKTLEEIQASERRYLQKYSKRGFLTDIEYFVKAFRNIVFKKARSG